MKRLLIATAVASVIYSPIALSRDSRLEEVVVRASFVDPSAEAKPVHVVGAETLEAEPTQSIGELLDNLPGVSSTDFGVGVGHPVIRGLSGTRVRVLQNNMVIRDVAGLGPDHPIDIDLNGVEQVEVVLGAAAMLYANGASGGVINVVDSTIATTDFTEQSLDLGYESQSVNDGSGFSGNWSGNVGGLNFSAAYKQFDSDNYEIPEVAVLDDGHDDHGMDELNNSDFESEVYRFGVSKTGDWGFLGASFQRAENLYGIPFHVEPEGAHGHGDDEDDHDDEGDHDDHDEHGDDHDDHDDHDEQGEERIFAKTESNTIALQGEFVIGTALLNSIGINVRDSDYELIEGHAEEEGHDDEDEGGDHDHGHGEHEQTTFINQATEVQVVFNLGGDNGSSKLVFNRVEEDQSILGSEAFMQPVSSTETMIGYFASTELAGFDIDWGARWDSVKRRGSIVEHHDEEEEEEHDDHDDHELETMGVVFDDSALSASVLLSRNLSKALTLSLGASSVSKSPSSIELFMDGAHLAVGRYEEGSVDLETERSNDLDIALDYGSDDWFARAALYRNSVKNYIYLRDELEEEHDDHDEELDHHDDDGDHYGDHGGLPLAEYQQADATFTGYELELGRTLAVAGGVLEAKVQRDQVWAEFSGGENVPRIIPARNVFALAFTKGQVRSSVELINVESQNDVSMGELPTDSFTLVNALLSYGIDLSNDRRLTLSAFGKNLTDDVARNHSSFVKQGVPLPGRNIGVTVRLSL